MFVLTAVLAMPTTAAPSTSVPIPSTTPRAAAVLMVVMVVLQEG